MISSPPPPTNRFGLVQVPLLFIVIPKGGILFTWTCKASCDFLRSSQTKPTWNPLLPLLSLQDPPLPDPIEAIQGGFLLPIPHLFLPHFLFLSISILPHPLHFFICFFPVDIPPHRSWFLIEHDLKWTGSLSGARYPHFQPHLVQIQTSPCRLALTRRYPHTIPSDFTPQDLLSTFS